MLKKSILILVMFFAAPVFAGVYEDAIEAKNNVALYMYTQSCGSCKHFSPIFDALAQNNRNAKFIKVDANGQYGNQLMRRFDAHYVPYVILVNGKTGQKARMQNECVHDYRCADGTIKSFFK